MSVLAQANQEVDITKIPPQQLVELKKAIEAEVQQLTMHYQQLIAAIKKFQDSRGVLAYMQQKANGKEVMVPLTSSLYVPGVMEDSQNVLVEVGAGYFVEKSTDSAGEYCDRKARALQENSDKVGRLVQGKKMQLQRVQDEYEKRVKAMQAQMAAAQAAK